MDSSQKLPDVVERDIAKMTQPNRVVFNEREWKRLEEIMKAPIQMNTDLERSIREFRATQPSN